MGLSNTATPKYYGLFRDKVVSGEIPVNEEVSMEMNRIDALIANPNYWYDDLAVEGFVKFCETELTLTDGSSLHLLDTTHNEFLEYRTSRLRPAYIIVIIWFSVTP